MVTQTEINDKDGKVWKVRIGQGQSGVGTPAIGGNYVKPNILSVSFTCTENGKELYINTAKILNTMGKEQQDQELLNLLDEAKQSQQSKP
jgi:hypothetical protein